MIGAPTRMLANGELIGRSGADHRFEGILALVDERLRSRARRRGSGIRVMQRIRGDLEHRGRTFTQVRKQYDESVRPSKRFARVVLDKSQGPITIHVATAMTMKSSFVDTVNPGTRFLLQYFGTASVDLDPFNGTFVAPNASVDLSSPSAGVFLAKELHAKSKVIITRRAFDPACQ